MQATVFIRRTYDETMSLMVEARNYMRYVEFRERGRVEANTGLRMSCEAMRVTSRLTQVMAWLLMQRAVEEGEITAEQALDESNRLSGGKVCLDDTYAEDNNLPRGLRSLMDRSLRLYSRIVRLESQMVERTIH